MQNRLHAAFCSNRRRLLHLAAGAAALPIVSRFRLGAGLSDTARAHHRAARAAPAQSISLRV